MASSIAIWLGVMKTESSPGSLKSVWAAKETDGGERGFVARCELRGGDGEQCAADAIADRVHRLLWHAPPHFRQRRQKAELHVIVHAELAVPGVRVLPRDHEDRVPLLDQVAHQGIARREVEDVVLHDPRRGDQDRLGVDVRGLRGVLQQLDEAVAEHHLAGRDRHLLADLEGLGAGGASALDRAARVVEPVLEAADQILPGLGGRALQELGVGLQEVGRGGRLEQHAPGEIRPRECGGVRAGLRLQRFLPPGGPVGVGARIGVEGPDVPGFPGKTQFLVTGRQRLPAGGAGEELPAVERLLVGAAGEGGLAVRVRPEVQIPVPPGARVVIGGQSAGDGSQLRA